MWTLRMRVCRAGSGADPMKRALEIFAFLLLIVVVLDAVILFAVEIGDIVHWGFVTQSMVTDWQAHFAANAIIFLFLRYMTR